MEPEGAPPPELRNENNEFSGIVDAIANEVWQQCAAACDAITTNYAAQMDHARKTQPQRRVLATIATLYRDWQTALKKAREEAAAEIRARQKEAAIRFRRAPQRPSDVRREPNDPQGPRK